MGIFIAYPWLAIVFAGSFAALWGWRRKPAAAFSCIAWAAYGVYEYLMLTRPGRSFAHLSAVASRLVRGDLPIP